MYENIDTAIQQLADYQIRLNTLQAMLPAVQGGAIGSIIVQGVGSSVPLPQALVTAGINSEVTRLTSVSAALKAKLDAASAAVG